MSVNLVCIYSRTLSGHLLLFQWYLSWEIPLCVASCETADKTLSVPNATLLVLCVNAPHKSGHFLLPHKRIPYSVFSVTRASSYMYLLCLSGRHGELSSRMSHSHRSVREEGGHRERGKERKVRSRSHSREREREKKSVRYVRSKEERKSRKR